MRNFGKKTWEVLNNDEIGNQVTKTMVGSVASIAGVKFFYDVPEYFRERFKVRGFRGKGGVKGSVEEIVTSFKEDREKEEGQPRKEIVDLEKRLLLTKDAKMKGSEARKIMAEVIRQERGKKSMREFEGTKDKELLDKVLGEYDQKLGWNGETKDKLMKSALDDYTETKVNGIQATREALNTAFVASGAYGLRGLSYSLMAGVERAQRVEKEARREGRGVEGKKEMFKKVVIDGIKETFQEAVFKGEGTKKQKALKAIKSYGSLFRFTGIGYTTIIRPEHYDNAIEKMLDTLDGKQNWSDVGRNFVQGIERRIPFMGEDEEAQAAETAGDGEKSKEEKLIEIVESYKDKILNNDKKEELKQMMIDNKLNRQTINSRMGLVDKWAREMGRQLKEFEELMTKGDQESKDRAGQIARFLKERETGLEKNFFNIDLFKLPPEVEEMSKVEKVVSEEDIPVPVPKEKLEKTESLVEKPSEKVEQEPQVEEKEEPKVTIEEKPEEPPTKEKPEPLAEKEKEPKVIEEEKLEKPPEKVKPKPKLKPEPKPVTPEPIPVPKPELEPEPFQIAEKVKITEKDSIWSVSRKYLESNKVFQELSQSGDKDTTEALQTFNIDRVKDTIVANPQEYGLPAGVNVDKLSAEQLKGINWQKAFADTFPEGKGLTEGLAEEQVGRIANNNKALRTFFQEHPNAPRSSENYEAILKGKGITGEELPAEKETIETVEKVGAEEPTPVDNIVEKHISTRTDEIYGSSSEEWPIMQDKEASDILAGEYGEPVGSEGLDHAEMNNRKELQSYLNEAQKLLGDPHENETVKDYLEGYEQAKLAQELEVDAGEVNEKLSEFAQKIALDSDGLTEQDVLKYYDLIKDMEDTKRQANLIELFIDPKNEEAKMELLKDTGILEHSRLGNNGIIISEDKGNLKLNYDITKSRNFEVIINPKGEAFVNGPGLWNERHDSLKNFKEILQSPFKMLADREDNPSIEINNEMVEMVNSVKSPEDAAKVLEELNLSKKSLEKLANSKMIGGKLFKAIDVDGNKINVNQDTYFVRGAKQLLEPETDTTDIGGGTKETEIELGSKKDKRETEIEL